jgi:hypothetical protein
VEPVEVPESSTAAEALDNAVPGVSFVAPLNSAVPGVSVVAPLDSAVPEISLAASLGSAVLAVAIPATPSVAAEAVGSEPSSSPSFTLEGATGGPFGARRSDGNTGAATGGVVEAGGASLPDGGNASPLRLPASGLAESSLRLCLAETRSSVPAKSRAPQALAVASADATAFFELSCGGACLGAATRGVRTARMAAFMPHEEASDVPSGSATLHVLGLRARCRVQL